MGHHSALCLESLAFDAGESGRNEILGCREKNGEKTLHDQVVELLFRLGQMSRQLHRRDDREVVGNLLVVEYAPIRLDPAVPENLGSVPRVSRGFLRRKSVQRLLHRTEVVLGQRTRIRPRIGESLVLFVQCLCEPERGLRRKAEAAVRFTLQARQVVEQRGKLRYRFRLLGGNARLPETLLADGCGPLLVPQPLRPCFAVFFCLLEAFVEPTASVLALRGGKRRVDFPIVARLETAYAILALDENRERRGLHTADRGLVKTAFFRVEGCHGACAVDADEPVRLGAAQGSVG